MQVESQTLIAYSVLVALLQFAILLLPLVFQTIELSELVALQFLGSIVSSWAAMFLDGLKTRHLWFSLLIYVIFAAPVALLFTVSFPMMETLVSRIGLVSPTREIKSILQWGILSGVALEFAAFLLVASGLWMKSKRAPYLFRRAGTNRQEKDLLFDLRTRVVSDEMTNFKYVSLQTACPGVVMEYRGDILAFLRFFLHEGTVVIFDLIILPEARVLPHSRMLPDLIRKVSDQPGLENVTLAAMLPAEDEDSIQRALLSGAGFEQGDLDPELSQYIRDFRLPGFEDWQPFRGPFETWLLAKD